MYNLAEVWTFHYEKKCPNHTAMVISVLIVTFLKA